MRDFAHTLATSGMIAGAALFAACCGESAQAQAISDQGRIEGAIRPNFKLVPETPTAERFRLTQLESMPETRRSIPNAMFRTPVGDATLEGRLVGIVFDRSDAGSWRRHATEQIEWHRQVAVGGQMTLRSR